MKKNESLANLKLWYLPALAVILQSRSPPSRASAPWTAEHVTVQRGGSHSTPRPRDASRFPTVVAGETRTTSRPGKTASSSASEAERVRSRRESRNACSIDWLQKGVVYNVAALFCRRSREEDDPNKEEKHQRHCSPLSLKTLDLWSHPYLCPYFIVSFTHICGFVVLLYLTCISFVAPECNYHYPHYFHISHWQKNTFVLLMSNIATLYTVALCSNAFV